jgi:hypothetical protein
MGLLDALFSNDTGGGLLGGLPSSWQWQNPADANTNKDFLAALRQDPSMGNNLVAPQSPFGAVPSFAQQPQSVFASGTGSIAPSPGMMPPQAPQMPPQSTMQQPAPPPVATPAPAPAPQNNPINSMNVGGYQMPQFGSAADYTPQATASAQSPTDFSAQSRQSSQPQTQPTFMGSGQGIGIGDRFNAGMQNFANAGGPLQALAGGISGLVSGNRTDAQGMQQQNLKAQYDSVRQALINNGDTPQAASSKAMVAALNPEAAKTILPELFTNKTELKMVKDALGAEHPYSWNAREQTFKPVGSDGEMSGGASGQGGVSLLAPGVKEYNPSLSGDAYLGQFGPEVQAAVKAYIKGDVMPSGNPRTQAIASKAKEIAQKYGQDMGIPVSDALYGEKRKYYTELGTNSPNSAGGQAKAFNQGISHMTGLADNLEKLDNSNGLGIPVIAQGVNATRQAFSNQQSAISDEAKSLGQTVAGEVGKLFSGSAGGGVHERELTRERFDTVKSKPQLAAALRATLETMDGGLKALEQRRDSILGPNNGVDLVSNDTRQNIIKIQGAIDRLEGKSSAAPTGGIPSGWSVKVH